MLQTKAIMILRLWDFGKSNFEGTLLGKVVGLQQELSIQIAC
jgi:hypothetical protein